MTFVALLRGINVGGANIIPMAALKALFEELGFAKVRTFIASGNVIFEAPKQNLRKLEAKLELALGSRFDYNAKVVVKSKDELDAIVKGMPAAWKKASDAFRYYVIFLSHVVDSKAVLDTLTPRAGVETIAYKPGALYWQIKKSDITKSKLSKQLMQRPLYQESTNRNLNTTLELAELVK